MKRILLYLLLLVSASSVRAASEFTYGICSDEINGVGTGMAGSNYSAAIEVPEAVAKQLQGGKLTKVSIGFKSGLNKVVNVYLTYDLEGEPFYTQEGRVKVNAFNDTEFDTPYIIEGRKFYIGYTYRQSSSTGKPIGFDDIDMGGMCAFSHLAAWPDGGKPEWGNYAKFGALSIRATIETDKEIENCIIPVGLRLPKAVNLNKKFNYELDVLNYGNKAASGIQTVASFGSKVTTTDTEFDSPLAPGKRTTVKLSATSTDETPELPVSIDIPTVDGTANVWAALPATAEIVSSDFIFSRVLVLEEATGIGCGYCPAGYVAMEQLRERHPDDYIGISVHNYGGDPMYCASYVPWENVNVSGYPSATFSRIRSIGTFSPQPATCEAYYQELSGVVNLRFEIQAEYADDTHQNARVMTMTNFGYNVDNSRYAIALVETEDNVGPYNQYNGYSGGGSGSMYGFEDMGRYVSLIYNDVARAIHNWQGDPESLPYTIKANEPYFYEKTISLKTIPSKHEDMNLIALLIDRSNGEITTAAKCKLGKIDFNPSSVEEVQDIPGFAVRAYANGIALEGLFDKAEVFGVDGALRAVVTSAGHIELPSGMYLVRVADGSKIVTKKLIVK